MKATFPAFTHEGQTRQYGVTDTHMLAVVDGVEYSAPMTEEQHDKFFTFGPHDYVKHARLFDEVSDNVIERETGVKSIADLVDEKPAA